ncbi:hypothetical protein MLD38_027196 [Melastoma candidum]|uniref:Uncharacterized protein n=1 Tax=Melastoma candidum TaxID=119954 RepID=A0ACB9P5N5_9MYRT|nr:hypothetical protein MLD38_027196 [Melastoma candidum]
MDLGKKKCRERANILSDKPYIIIKGQKRRMTEVVWDDHENVAQSPTFTSLADMLIFSDYIFPNLQDSYNNPASDSNPHVPAGAALISGGKSYFYWCEFYGFQDTLLDNQGRHCYESCTIQGAVDSIFGRELQDIGSGRSNWGRHIRDHSGTKKGHPT